MTVRDFVRCVERHAPPWLAFPDDPVGLQIGNPEATVTKLLVSLDPSMGAALFGRAHGCDAWLLHHPLLAPPVRGLVENDPTHRVATFAIRERMAVMAAHTNWDVAKGGVNDVLCELFGLSHTREFGSGVVEKRYKVTVYLPADQVEGMRAALSVAGAGDIGGYASCAFVTEGSGRFRAPEASSPRTGQAGQDNICSESKLEMVVPAGNRSDVQAALLGHHPYEEPAYDWFLLDQSLEHKAGRIGQLPKAMGSDEFQNLVDQTLGCRSEMWAPEPKKQLRTVAFVGGSASVDWSAALEAGADVFVTGEVRQRHAVSACDSGLGILAAGHYATEQPGIVRLGELVAAELGIPLAVYTPNPGTYGRPK